MDTLAPYAIDRMDFPGMLGDCFEIVMRAANGQAIGEIDDDGNAVKWVEAAPEERMRDAGHAFERVAYEAIQLCASGNAVDKVCPVRIEGERFMDYCNHHALFANDLMDRYEAAKTAVEYELGIDTEEPYEGLREY